MDDFFGLSGLIVAPTSALVSAQLLAVASMRLRSEMYLC